MILRLETGNPDFAPAVKYTRRHVFVLFGEDFCCHRVSTASDGWRVTHISTGLAIAATMNARTMKAAKSNALEIVKTNAARYGTTPGAYMKMAVDGWKSSQAANCAK